MLKRGVLFTCFWLLSFIAVGSPELSGPLAGRFVGTAKMSDGLLQIVTADFVPLERSTTKIQYIGFVKFIFGAPSSHEYVTYRFPEIFLNLANGNITAEPTEQNLLLNRITLDTKAGKLDMKGLVSSSGKDQVVFKLSRKGDYHDDGFVRPELEGIYESTCNNQGKPDLISLVTSRHYTETSLGWNPFGDYQITGAMARWYRDGRGQSRYQTLYGISSGIYNFFNGETQLQGFQYYSCKVNAEGLLCDRCLFRSLAGPAMHIEEVPWEKLLHTTFDPSINIRFDTPTDSTVPYEGYIHHATTGVFQKVQVYLSAKPTTAAAAADGGTTSISISAQIVQQFLRGKDLPPVLHEMRFETRTILSPKKTGITLLNLPRPFLPADPALHITHLNKNEIRGYWYSLIYGLVGEFVASTKTPSPPTKEAIKWIHALDGIYDGGVYPAFSARYMVGVESIPGRFVPRSGSPFFPLTLGGYAMVNSSASPGVHRRLVDGGYDFYTGRFNLGSFFVGDVVPGSSPPKIRRIDITQTSVAGFVPRYDPSGSWSWAMPFQVFRKPRDYWPHLDGGGVYP